MQQFSGIEYLCIDIANNFGKDKTTGFKGDKDTFTNRIQWVKDNFHKLEQRTDEVDEDKYLYIKGVQALRKVVRGEPTGHLIMLDATCSGMQILSALTGCIKGARITNMLKGDVRYDAYTVITEAMQNVLNNRGHNGFKVLRPDAKQAVMTSLYGSVATPKEIFVKDEIIDAFYSACYEEAPGAFSTLKLLRNAWQPHVLEHYWVMPDGFACDVKVLQKKETRVEIDELNHHKFRTSYTVNEGSETGISLPANVTHSVDAYVLRNVVRRCNYNPKQVKAVLKLLKGVNEETVVEPTDEVIQEQIILSTNTNIVDSSWVELITKETVNQVPLAITERLIKLLEQMLVHKPFDVLTVHDAFRIHANNGDVLRYWYKEILAELAESNLLANILFQITGMNVHVPKLSRNLGNMIRESDYAIC